jgi:dienelactone hydrolase
MENVQIQLQSHLLSPENVAGVPPPGLSGPSQISFAPSSSRYLAYVTTTWSINNANSFPIVNNSSSTSNNWSDVGASSAATANRHGEASQPLFSPSYSPYVPLTDGLTIKNQKYSTNESNNGANSKKKASTSNSTTITPSTTERIIMYIDLESESKQPMPLLHWPAGTPAYGRRGSGGGNGNNLRSSSKRRMLENGSNSASTSLDEKLRRERQRTGTAAGSITQFSWARCSSLTNNSNIVPNATIPTKVYTTKRDSNDSCDLHEPFWRILVPVRGSIFVQDGLPLPSLSDSRSDEHAPHPLCSCIYDKVTAGVSAIDAQLSPDGSMVAWTADGELYVQGVLTSNMEKNIVLNNSTAADAGTANDAPLPPRNVPVRISFGASHTDERAISHGVADFVAQEEMDRYRGFWWHPDSTSILFTRNDESQVPIYRIMHNQHDSEPNVGSNGSGNGLTPYHINNSNHDVSMYTAVRHNASSMFEDHRYPFAGKSNPKVKLGLVQVHRESICNAYVTAPMSLGTLNSFNSDSADDCRWDRDDGNSRQSADDGDVNHEPMQVELSAQEIACENWERCQWFDPPREASEYLARVYWLADGTVICQWQNRSQNCSLLYRLDLRNASLTSSTSDTKIFIGRTLLVERTDMWINLHHMFKPLKRAIHPDECACDLDVSSYIMPNPLPNGSFSFVVAMEKTGFQHLYLFTYCPGVNGEQAVLLRTLTSGEWMVEQIIGIDLQNDVIYFTGTYDSVLERHMYAVSLLGRREKQCIKTSSLEASMGKSSNMIASPSRTSSPKMNGTVRRSLNKVMNVLSGSNRNNSPTVSKVKLGSFASNPVRLTTDTGMHSLVMDDNCRYFVDTSSDLDRPTTVNIFEIVHERIEGTTRQMGPDVTVKRVVALYDASKDDKSINVLKIVSAKLLGGSDILVKSLPPPEMLSFITTDGTETLHAAVYRPDPKRYGPGPYPLVCAVYGGPHVQRVNRSWAQCADMRAQRLRSLGFCVVKCDNRGSSRRGLKFESGIAKRLGRLEVIDQVSAVQQLVFRGIADPTRVGVYGWSYGGYLAAMCLCRAPEVFHVAVAGAPVTSWDGYDTHYTERYMGLPADNPAGYRESAIFDHVPNMRGKLMLVHGLIDENVHFRHSSRLINRLIAAGKDYDLLVFPEERHSPRRLRDRIYMEKKISEYFVRHLRPSPTPNALDHLSNGSNVPGGLRTMAGHL